ncbi:hypothetical protein [Peribacillus frigoritolerans]|uniref:hypothetical protein n=1 Tax=Peribacillus frigoritolerans TaxID=450367 RepID=UPI003F80EA12
MTAAGLINALKLVKKTMNQIRVVVNGTGAAGISIIKLLLDIGVKDIILFDTKGIIYKECPVGMNKIKSEISKINNKEEGHLVMQ